MKQLSSKILAVLCAMILLTTSTYALGESTIDGDSFLGKSTDFTLVISNALSVTDFGDYQNLPSMQYVLTTREFDPDQNGNARTVNLTVMTPPADSSADYVNTLISTGEYADVMDISMASTSAIELYDEGNGEIMDITDYVMQYMPNYRAYFERHPEFAGKETVLIDGEPRYICLYHVEEVAPWAWSGMMYRRDWIVKYGTNPETGEAFSGAWDEDGNWVDNVVFPSGNTDPIYVSDWNWMLEIFQKALEEQGIEDGYAYSCNISGRNGVGGDMESGFGTASTWYINPETGLAEQGYTADGFRAYLTMMHEWYEKGYVNPYFEENANDMFFMIDMGSVYSGKVGAWYGLTSQIGNSLGGDAVVLGAPTPINDVYGDESVQGHEPFLYYAASQFVAQNVISKKAAEKDLPALFTFLDYFYSEEGSRIKTYGLNAEEMKELEVTNPESAALYTKWGMGDGAYIVTDEGLYLRNEVIRADDNMKTVSNLTRLLGVNDESKLDQGWLPYYAHTMSLFRMYDHSHVIDDEIISQMTAEESATYQDTFQSVQEYTNRELAKFITGERDISNDDDWNDYCATIHSYGTDEVDAIFNRILGN